MAAKHLREPTGSDVEVVGGNGVLVIAEVGTSGESRQMRSDTTLASLEEVVGVAF